MSTSSEPARLSSRTLGILAALFAVAPLVHWLALGPRAPHGTFLLISQLSEVAPRDDPSNIIYAFARPPIYALLGWVWVYPLAHLGIGFIAHALFNGCVFGLLYAACRAVPSARVPPWVVAATLTVLVFPLGWVGRLIGLGATLVPHDA